MNAVDEKFVNICSRKTRREGTTLETQLQMEG